MDEDFDISHLVLSNLNKMRTKGLCCDGVLATKDGGMFRIHRVIMASCSSYFRALFTSLLNNIGSGEGSEKTFAIVPNVSSTMLEKIIEFAYTGQTDITETNVVETMLAADQFNIMEMVDSCSNFLSEKVNFENCLGIWELTKNYFFPVLQEDTYNFITNNFPLIAETSEEYLDLPFESLQEILTSDRLILQNEEVAWTAIARWCGHNLRERCVFIPQLLKCLRLGVMPLTVLQRIMTHSLVMRNVRAHPFMKTLAQIVLQGGTSSEENIDEFSGTFTPRYPQKIIVCVGGWSFRRPTSLVEVYDAQANTWKLMKCEDPKGVRAYHKCISLGIFIYVLGGTEGNICLNSCRKFNTWTETWDEIAPMNEPRCYICAAVLLDKIYAIGGYDGYKRLNSAEVYDHDKNQWYHITNMNDVRSDASACALFDRIIVVGGYNGNRFLKSAECYFPDSDQWVYLEDMNFPRSGVNCIGLGNYVYVFGGYNGIDRLYTAEKYNSETRQWVALKRMKQKRSNFAIAVMGHKIYIMGGYDGNDTTDKVECFDTVKHAWTSVKPLQLPRSAIAACTQGPLKNIEDYVLSREHRSLLKYSPRTPSGTGENVEILI